MKFRLLLLCFLVAISGGCEVFQAPLSLFQELLPLAIKYAPYALMFIEAPESDIDSQQDSKKFYAQFAQIVKDPARIPSMSCMIAEELKKNSSGKKIILAIHLSSWEKVEQVQMWLRQNEGKFKIRYCIANCDFETEKDSRIKEKWQNSNVAFWVDGPARDFLPQNLEVAQSINFTPAE